MFLIFWGLKSVASSENNPKNILDKAAR